MSAIAAAAELGISIEDIQEGLSGFSGPHRRFEKKGEIGGITIIDDYAHHPQEIHATLSAAKNYPHKTLWCVFQPHTYTRTKALMDDFAKSLAEADEVVLADIYPARETDNLRNWEQKSIIFHLLTILRHFFWKIVSTVIC